ncbi:hypothetical protein DPMN_050630 [Dreissena polymorpha]|uniref:Sine oculis-binding protein homolog n=2 Tax=Dreissena polymorpha TaxID=45954 RepID=A0A9D4CGH3_DREPO|nr:hypothetical protein DPMN_050630 [Dreissena polymorpha]
MNELLGLFGYDDKVNSRDTENLNLDNYADKEDETSDVIDDVKCDKRKSTAARLKSRLRHRLYPASSGSLARHHMNLINTQTHKEPTVQSGETDTGSNDEASSDQKQCSWCHKYANHQLKLDTPSGNREFCSEQCFTQCRRASFKKSKSCDWCKHVRHALNYVEFTDGETQLQFCSEKCLNQYKMSVFCQETQELSGRLEKTDGKGEVVSCGDRKFREKILITPDLWLVGRAAEARETARERERLEREMRRDGPLRTSSAHDQTLDLSLKVHTREETKDRSQTHIEHAKHDSCSKRNRTSALNDSEKSSVERPDVQRSPAHDMTGGIPPHLLHPLMAGMAPWLQHAQFLGSLPPGMMQYGQMLAAYTPTPNQNQDANKCSVMKSNDKHFKQDQTAASALLTPNRAEVNHAPSVSPRREHRNSPLPDRRTSSLFPVDFPHFLQNGVLPGPFPAPAGHSFQSLPGMPPVTMMFPFPVILPLPVPIPIPIPMTVKQLATAFGHKLEEPKTISIKTEDDSIYGTKSPVCHQNLSPHSSISSVSDISPRERYQVRSGSRSSCPDMTYVRRHTRETCTEHNFMKRSLTHESLDLSVKSKIPKYDCSSFTSDEDGVIDLSAYRENGHKSDDTSFEPVAENGASIDDGSRSPESKEEGEVASVPKIHIVTHKDETPLNAPLPLPPTEHPYSSRRGLILDAPAVSKKSRTPSPERRVYVRNVPRDIIEAARRRCSYRTRIRTK